MEPARVGRSRGCMAMKSSMDVLTGHTWAKASLLGGE